MSFSLQFFSLVLDKDFFHLKWAGRYSDIHPHRMGECDIPRNTKVINNGPA